MDLTSFVTPAVTVVLTLITGYIAMKNATNDKFQELFIQIATLTAKVDDMRSQVEKHNGVVERTFKLERDMKTAFKMIDELKEADLRLSEKAERR